MLNAEAREESLSSLELEVCGPILREQSVVQVKKGSPSSNSPWFMQVRLLRGANHAAQAYEGIFWDKLEEKEVRGSSLFRLHASVACQKQNNTCWVWLTEHWQY